MGLVYDKSCHAYGVIVLSLRVVAITEMTDVDVVEDDYFN